MIPKVVGVNFKKFSKSLLQTENSTNSDLKSLSFLTFSEKCNNQGSFYKCLIINKNAILHLPEVMGEDKKTLTIFQV